MSIRLRYPFNRLIPGTVMDYDVDRNTKTSFKNSIEHIIRGTPSKVVEVQQRKKPDPKTGQQYVSVRITV